MTDEQLLSFVKAILATGFSAGVSWALSDKKADTCRATLDECLKENVAFFRTIADINGGQNVVQ